AVAAFEQADHPGEGPYSINVIINYPDIQGSKGFVAVVYQLSNNVPELLRRYVIQDHRDGINQDNVFTDSSGDMANGVPLTPSLKEGGGMLSFNVILMDFQTALE
ncbi:hypothetical protein, partial [Salinicola aestuarinus]|uniref:hypothetical protein n=1 Tax=Salinicola aestuarinus TaxID=1949082 RepID=UPI0013004A18